MRKIPPSLQQLPTAAPSEPAAPIPDAAIAGPSRPGADERAARGSSHTGHPASALPALPRPTPPGPRRNAIRLQEPGGTPDPAGGSGGSAGAGGARPGKRKRVTFAETTSVGPLRPAADPASSLERAQLRTARWLGVEALIDHAWTAPETERAALTETAARAMRSEVSAVFKEPDRAAQMQQIGTVMKFVDMLPAPRKAALLSNLLQDIDKIHPDNRAGLVKRGAESITAPWTPYSTPLFLQLQTAAKSVHDERFQVVLHDYFRDHLSELSPVHRPQALHYLIDVLHDFPSFPDRTHRYRQLSACVDALSPEDRPQMLLRLINNVSILPEADRRSVLALMMSI